MHLSLGVPVKGRSSCIVGHVGPLLETKTQDVVASAASIFYRSSSFFLKSVACPPT